MNERLGCRHGVAFRYAPCGPTGGNAMAKAKQSADKGAKVEATAKRTRAKPVRLDLADDEHERLQGAADRLGLSMASCARMAVLSWLHDQDEEPTRGKGRK